MSENPQFVSASIPITPGCKMSIALFFPLFLSSCFSSTDWGTHCYRKLLLSFQFLCAEVFRYSIFKKSYRTKWHRKIWNLSQASFTWFLSYGNVFKVAALEFYFSEKKERRKKELIHWIQHLQYLLLTKKDTTNMDYFI